MRPRVPPPRAAPSAPCHGMPTSQRFDAMKTATPGHDQSPWEVCSMVQLEELHAATNAPRAAGKKARWSQIEEPSMTTPPRQRAARGVLPRPSRDASPDHESNKCSDGPAMCQLPEGRHQPRPERLLRQRDHPPHRAGQGLRRAEPSVHQDWWPAPAAHEQPKQKAWRSGRYGCLESGRLHVELGNFGVDLGSVIRTFL